MPKKPTTSTKKIVDVAHPGTVKADATGVPLIVSNRPILRDPMVVEESDQGEQAEALKPQAAEQEPIIKKIKLEPLVLDGTASKDDTSNEERVTVTVTKGAPKVNEAKLADLPKEIEPVAATEVPEVAARADEPAVATAAESEPATVAPPEAEPVEKTEEKPVEPEATTETEQADKPAEAKTDAPSEEIKATESADLDLAADAKSDDGNDLLTDDKQANPEAVKEARQAAEKQLAMDKLVSEGTYVLPINTVETRRIHRTVALVLLILVVLAIAGCLLALDAGYITIPGVSAPTDFIKN